MPTSRSTNPPGRARANPDPEGACEHEWARHLDVCVRCGFSGTAIDAGRDKPATWEDVDLAYEHGLRNGGAFARADRRVTRREIRRRGFRIGAWWLMRRLMDGEPSSTKGVS